MSMDFVADPGVSQADLDRATTLVRRDVIPALRRVFGASYAPPPAVLFRGGAGSGVVHITGDTDGFVEVVRQPEVAVGGPDELVRNVLCHELAHHHELSVRKQRRMTTGDLRSSLLWTEYFAIRTTWAAGFGIPFRDLLRLTPEAVQNPEAEVQGRACSSSLLGDGYMTAWALGDYDHNPGMGTFDGMHPAEIRALCGRSMNLFGDLYRRFPKWPPAATRGLPALVGFLLDSPMPVVGDED